MKEDIKNFTPINLELLGSKVRNDKVYINIKNNQSVWDILNDDVKLSAINEMLNLVPYEMYESGIKLPQFNIKNNPNNNNINNINNFNQLNNNNVNNNNLNKDKKNIQSNNMIILTPNKAMPENKPKVIENYKKHNSDNIQNNIHDNFFNSTQNSNQSYNQNTKSYNQNTFQNTNNQNNYNFNNANPSYRNKIPQNNINPNYNTLNNRPFVIATTPINNNIMMPIHQNISNTGNHY